MGLLPEQSNDLGAYMRETKGTPYAPYSSPVENRFARAVTLVTVFPLMGILLPIAVDNTVVDLLSYAMLGLCPLIGIPAMLLGLGSDAAHRKNDEEATEAKAKTARMLATVGLGIGSVVTTVAIVVAFYGFLGGGGHVKAEAKAPAAAATAEEGAPAEGDAAKPEDPKADAKGDKPAAKADAKAGK